MPLCRIDRRGKEKACLHEHMESEDKHDGCGWKRMLFKVPAENLLYKELPARTGTEREGNVRRKDKIPKKEEQIMQRHQRERERKFKWSGENISHSPEGSIC